MVVRPYVSLTAIPLRHGTTHSRNSVTTTSIIVEAAVPLPWPETHNATTTFMDTQTLTFKYAETGWAEIPLAESGLATTSRLINWRRY
jgi:hypothetical protein